MCQARVGYDFEGFEGEIKKIVLFGEDFKWSSYAELLEYLEKQANDSDSVRNDRKSKVQYGLIDY